MLKSQEITLAQSKRREKMAALQKGGDLNEDGVKELRSLTEGYETGEVELRAALLLEGAERDKIKEPDKAATDFERECRSFSVSALIASATEGKALSGREAEVSQELETRYGPAVKGQRLPWEALEQRADVTTDISGSANLASKPVANALERFFEASASAAFGIQALQVTGAPSFPAITGGAAMSWVGEGSGVDAAAISTATQTPTIKTATARYLLSRQSIRANSALELSLRRDLAELLREGTDASVFTGSGASNEPAGLETVLGGTSREIAYGAEADYAGFLDHIVSLMETAKVPGSQSVRLAGAPLVWGRLVRNLLGGTSFSDLDLLKRDLQSMTFSSQVSSWAAKDATGKGASNVYMAAGQGLGFVPVWGAPELIVDPYSESKTGKVALTIFAFQDVLIQRQSTHWLMLSGVQDRP